MNNKNKNEAQAVERNETATRHGSHAMRHKRGSQDPRGERATSCHPPCIGQHPLNHS
jgi:hypothetical protein